MTMLITDGAPRGLGYVEVDHRACDLPDIPGNMPKHFEADTYTCSHCQFVVVMNPERKRERYKCLSCNHHVCDGCAAKMHQTGLCESFNRRVDEAREQAIRQLGSPSILLP